MSSIYCPSIDVSGACILAGASNLECDFLLDCTMTFENSALLTESPAQYEIHATLLIEETIASDDRLVLKTLGTPEGSGGDPTVTIYMEGATATRLEVRSTPSALDERYVRKDGGNAEFADRYGFVDRGNRAAYDWTVGDFITDLVFRDLDCSGIVPAGAKAILFKVSVMDDVVSSLFQIKNKDHANAHNSSAIWTQIANVQIQKEWVCSCDANRFVQYRGTISTFLNIDLLVKGWFF